MISYAEEFITFKLGDKTLEVSFPKVSQLKFYDSNIRDVLLGKSQRDVYEIQEEYLAMLGLKKEDYENMLQKQINDLLEYLNGQKKISV